MQKNVVDWVEAVRLWKAGYSCSAIARQCGGSPQAVHKGLLKRGLLVRTPEGMRRVVKPAAPAPTP